MRVQVLENSRDRLHLTLSTNVPLYAVFALLFVGMGLWSLPLLAVQARIAVEQQQFTYTRTCLWIFECASVRAPVQDVRAVALVGSQIDVELPDGAHRLALPDADGDEKAVIVRDL